MYLTKCSKVPYPALCLVTDGGRYPTADTVDIVSAAVLGGVNIVQLRENKMHASDLLNLGYKLREITTSRALLFVNDRIDVALACEADGVQLGEFGIPLPVARTIAGSDLLIGRSVHDPGRAVVAQEEGADLLVVGTIFPSQSHPDGHHGGLQLLKCVLKEVEVPFLAIGGINPTNVRAIMEQGAFGAAVIGSIWSASDPEFAARSLWKEMSAATKKHHNELGE